MCGWFACMDHMHATRGQKSVSDLPELKLYVAVYMGVGN